MKNKALASLDYPLGMKIQLLMVKKWALPSPNPSQIAIATKKKLESDENGKEKREEDGDGRWGICANVVRNPKDPDFR